VLPAQSLTLFERAAQACRPCNNLLRAPTGRSSLRTGILNQNLSYSQPLPERKCCTTPRPRPRPLPRNQTTRFLDSTPLSHSSTTSQPCAALTEPTTSTYPPIDLIRPCATHPPRPCRPHTATFTTSVATPAAYTLHYPYATSSTALPQEAAMASAAVIWRESALAEEGIWPTWVCYAARGIEVYTTDNWSGSILCAGLAILTAVFLIMRSNMKRAAVGRR